MPKVRRAFNTLHITSDESMCRLQHYFFLGTRGGAKAFILMTKYWREILASAVIGLSSGTAAFAILAILWTISKNFS